MEAAALLKSVVQQLGKWMVEEAKYLNSVKDKVEGLQDELEWIQCFLRNANKMKRDDQMIIQKWISEINDFSYEAEDILEKYLLKVSNPRKEGGIWSQLKRTICVLRDARSTHKVGSEIDVLTSKISKLVTRMNTYGVKAAASYGESSLLSSSSLSKKAELRRTHSHLPVDDIVGLEDDTDVLVNRLMNKENEVITISGMAGSGKTTLARKVYHAVKGRFKMCAWIYVSQEFQPRDVIRGILLSLFANDQAKRNEIRKAKEQLHGKLFRVLEEKKCLVVLDDLWSSRDWNLLKDAFPTRNSSSKLIITTRYKDLFSQIDIQEFPHQPTLLNVEESLQLFEKKAFLGIDTKDPRMEQSLLYNEMRELGKDMVARCNYLPLAIVVLGGLLASKKTLVEWRSVHENVETILSRNDEETGVTGVLELSYTDLPYHLRPCFLHLGNFPEDSEIPTKKLYRMWIAEGIVAPKNNKPANLEDIANSYLRELVQRCIVQVVKMGPAGKIKACRLHDLMWEMCILKAKEINFLSVVRQDSESINVSNGNYSANTNGKLHRLAIHQSTFPFRFSKASHLRSLMFFGSSPVNNDDQGWLKAMINDFKVLRVLDFENTGIKEVPKELGNLVHLKYLSIMGTQVTKLPSSIGNLKCLQTLDLRVSLPKNCVIRIPNVLWRMKKLKHLYLPLYDYRVKGFKKLRVKGLSNLEILKNFDTRRFQVTNLHRLENLRKLSIKNQVTKIETLKTIIDCQLINDSKLVNLSLRIQCDILKGEATILSKCSCLHTLEMAGTDSAKTELNLENIKFPQNLTILAIRNCKLRSADMQKLKELPNLRSLTLEKLSFSENFMDCSYGGFSQLVDLKLIEMGRLKEWKVGAGAMPKLSSLLIKHSKELKIPEGLPALVEVECNPCVMGIDKYLTCPHYRVEPVDDDDDDLATQLLGKPSPFYSRSV